MNTENKLIDIENRLSRIESLIAALRDIICSDRRSDMSNDSAIPVKHNTMKTDSYPPEQYLNMHETIGLKLFNMYQDELTNNIYQGELEDNADNSEAESSEKPDDRDAFLSWLTSKLTDDKFKTDLKKFVSEIPGEPPEI